MKWDSAVPTIHTWCLAQDPELGWKFPLAPRAKQCAPRAASAKADPDSHTGSVEACVAPSRF